MKRIIMVLTVAALMAVMLVAGAGYAFAYSFSEEGNVTEQADENCTANVEKQTESEVAAGGGSKEGVPAPTNCDHFFQPEEEED
jgi:hypothetical protein